MVWRPYTTGQYGTLWDEAEEAMGGSAKNIRDLAGRPWKSRDGKRAASPTACIIDSQSVKSAEKGGPALILTGSMRAN